MSDENHAETIAKLTLEALAEPQIVTLADARIMALLPVGNSAFVLKDITEPHTRPAPLPSYVTQHVSIDNTESLIGYTNRFKNAASTLFADIDIGQIESVIDYHREDADPTHRAVAARLTAHTATLNLSASEEWGFWINKDGGWMSHIAFANLLEERSDDIIQPSGGELLEICRDLQGTRGHAVRSSTRSGGVRNIEFQKENDVSTRTGVALPDRFEIEIPVYFGEPVVNIRAMLRYEVDDNSGALKLGYKLLKLDQIKQDDFHRIVEEVRSATGLDTFYGSKSR